MQAPATTEPIIPEPRGETIPTRYVVIGVVAAIVIIALLVALVIWLAANFAEPIEAVRDIFIIALALQSCVFGVILVIMLMMLVRLVNMLEFEIKPILEKTNQTVGMVRGTTTFVSKNVVGPVTKATVYMAGIRQGLQTLFGNPRRE